MKNVWWVAAGAIVVTIAIGTFVLRRRRSDSMLPPVSEQWLAYHKREPNR